MSKESEFIVENNCGTTIPIYVEPEGIVVSLEHDERIVVSDRYDTDPVVVRVSQDASGARVLCIWPGDGDTIVSKDGVNVLDD